MFGFAFTPEAGLLGLLAVAFLSATLLPGGSELALIALLHHRPELLLPAIAVATLGNTLGGMTSYGIGRLLPRQGDPPAIATMKRYGYPALLLSWLPLVGDAFCVAAGWLRMNFWWVIVLMAVGKLARYVVVAEGFNWLRTFF